MSASEFYRENGLSKYILDHLLDNWMRDRKSLLEDKWNKNRAAYTRDGEGFDSLCGTWMEYQKNEHVAASEDEFNDASANQFETSVDWHSNTFLDITKQKVMAGE